MNATRNSGLWRTVVAVLGFVTGVVLPGSAVAQDSRPDPEPPPVEVQAGGPRPAGGIGLRGYASFETTRMTASRTFDAVFGTSDLTSFGAGAEVLRLWRQAFARVGFSRLSRDGGRVIVFDDEVTPVGVSTTVRMTPLEIAGGWRFSPERRLVPYAGAGLIRIAYDETTDFDQPADDTSGSFTGSLVFGGLDVQLAGLLGFGAELQHRRLPNALGNAGASAAFREDDLGGLTIRLWIGIGR